MGSELPKQFLLLGGKPVLMHTIEAFYRYDADIQVVLVLPRDHQDYWKSLCSSYHFEIPHRIVDGGETRFHSVRNGLQVIGGTGLVGVHDGVRPFVSKEVIERCYLEAEQKQAVIPVVEVVETVRHLQGDESSTVPRNEYRLVQTPQVFSVPLLKKAYLQPYSPSFTDDASVVESFGEKVFLTEGNRENIKITTPFDLIIGKAWVEHQ
jgi:2-C-methyl-D-erythritol 4-phosphate cytidylyltransferase